jgi:hypothetical protein
MEFLRGGRVMAIELAPRASKDDVFLFKSPGGLLEQRNDDLQPPHVFANNSSFIK